MIILKEPINLISQRPMTAGDSGFTDKLRANYELMKAQITPEELLLLVTAPPELPEAGVAETNIFNKANIRSSRQVNMQILNNVMNRILVENDNRFTYQDRVYITSVLEKLGVTDVNQFMKQVREMKDEHLHLARIFRTYEEHARYLQQGAAAERIQPAAAQKVGMEPATESVAERTLAETVYDRLQTAQIYRTMNLLAREPGADYTYISTREYQTAEQRRISNYIRADQYQTQTAETERTELTYRVNAYETGEALPEPQNAEEVRAQGASAVLLDMAENLFVTKLSRNYLNREEWVKTGDLAYTALNSLERFELYHTAEAERKVAEAIAMQPAVMQLRREQEAEELPLFLPGSESRMPAAEFHWGEEANYNEIFHIDNRAELPVPPTSPARQETVAEAEADMEHRAQEDRGEPQPLTEKERYEAIVREMERIDRQNREKLERVRELQGRQGGSDMRLANRQKTMEMSQRALTQQDLVLAEIAENAQRQGPEATMPQEVRSIMSVADQETVKVMRYLMDYRKNPNAAGKKGGIRPMTEGAFRADLAEAERQQAENFRKTETVLRETETATEVQREKEKLVTRIREEQKKTVQPATRREEPVRIVHRQVNNTAEAEVLEKLDRLTRHTTNKEEKQIEETVVNETVSQTEINNITKQIVTQSTEDITELVNRAMSKEMQVMTDKIYDQMERKLESERARRGRF